MAAKQGAHSRLKAKKEYAAALLIFTKSSTPNTPTTSSFATSPMMVAMAAVASPKPRGRKIHLMPLPKTPSTLSDSSSSVLNPRPPFTMPKQDPAQIRMEESKIMVPAFLIKEYPLSHMLLSTFPAAGQWYAGSSMTKGAGFPANLFVFFKMMPEITTAATPRK